MAELPRTARAYTAAFPLYACAGAREGVAALGGGGGAGNPGVRNGLELHAATGTERTLIRRYYTDPKAVMSVAFSPAEPVAVVGCDEVCRLVRLPDTRARTAGGDEGDEGDDLDSCVTCTVTRFACSRRSTARRDVRLAHVAASRCSVPGGDGAFQKCAALDAEGALLATGGTDGVVRVWQCRDGALTLLHELKVRRGAETDRSRVARMRATPPPIAQQHSDDINGLDFAPGGVELVPLGADRQAFVWNARSGAMLQPLQAGAALSTRMARHTKGCKYAAAAARAERTGADGDRWRARAGSGGGTSTRCTRSCTSRRTLLGRTA